MVVQVPTSWFGSESVDSDLDKESINQITNIENKKK